MRKQKQFIEMIKAGKNNQVADFEPVPLVDALSGEIGSLAGRC